MSKTFINILLTIFLIIPSLEAKKIPQDPALIKGKLSNGLTYYIYPNNKPKNEAVYRLFIKSGSVLEEENQLGLAHFLEHMAFNGTENYPNDSIITYLQSIGAKFGKDLNAHTSFNETVYKLSLPTTSQGKVDSAILILSDWAGRLSLKPEKIEKERGIIVSEWLNKQGPEYEARLTLTNEILGNSRYASRMTIGDTSIIKNFKEKELVDYYHKWYNPKLMAVAVVGDVDSKEVEKQIKKCFGNIASQSISEYKLYGIDSYDNVNYKIVSDSSFSKTEFEIIKILPALNSVKKEEDYKDFLTRSMLNKLFRNRFTELFYQDKPYFNAKLSCSDFINVSQIFYGSIELNPKKAESGIEEFFKDYNQIMKYGFTSKEIEKIKNTISGELSRKAEAKSQRESIKIMEEVYGDFYAGHKLITAEKEYKLFNKLVNKIDSIALLKVIKNLDFKTPHYLLTTQEKELKSLELSAIVTNSLNEKVTPYKQNINVPENLISNLDKKASIVKREKVDEIEAEILYLSNGSKVIYKQSNNDKDNTQISGFRKGGLFALDSTEYINGLYCSSIISSSGAGEYSREELSHYLAGKGVSVRFLIDKTRSGVACSANNSKVTDLFQLLYLRWTQPRVDSIQFQLIKNKSIEKIKMTKRTPDNIFGEKLSHHIQGESYVTRYISDSILDNELKKESLIPVFNQCFGNANDYNFIIISTLPLSSLENDIVKYIGALPYGETKQDYVFKQYTLPSVSNTLNSPTSDSPKGSISLIFNQNKLPGSLNDFNLKADILKSILRTKLLAELREKMGKIYSVGVSASATILPDTLARQTISFNCNPEDVDTLTNRTMMVINELIANPENMKESLYDVKENLKKSYLADIQKNSYWATSIRNTLCYNTPNWNFITDYILLVDEISVNDIAELMNFCFIESPCIKGYLLPKNKL